MKKQFIIGTLLCSLTFSSCEKEEEIYVEPISNLEEQDQEEEVDISNLIYIGREYETSKINTARRSTKTSSYKGKTVTSDWYDLNRSELEQMVDERGKKIFTNTDFLKNRFTSVSQYSKDRPKGILISHESFGNTKRVHKPRKTRYRSVGKILSQREVFSNYKRVPNQPSFSNINKTKRTKEMLPSGRPKWVISNTKSKKHSISKSTKYSLSSDFKVNDAFDITAEIEVEKEVTIENGETSQNGFEFTPDEKIKLKPGETGRWTLVKRTVQVIGSWENEMEFSGNIVGVYEVGGFLTLEKKATLSASKFFYEYADRSRGKKEKVNLILEEFDEYYIEAKVL